MKSNLIYNQNSIFVNAIFEPNSFTRSPGASSAVNYHSNHPLSARGQPDRPPSLGRRARVRAPLLITRFSAGSRCRRSLSNQFSVSESVFYAALRQRCSSTAASALKIRPSFYAYHCIVILFARQPAHRSVPRALTARRTAS